MDLTIEIDEGSGFCFGVTTAIRKAEEELADGRQLYCLGDIVHNGSECERLRALGLQTIDHEAFARLHEAKVLLRAHGEPPETYATARANRIDIIDATCPVVLQLQRRIKRVADQEPDAQVVIYGKPDPKIFDRALRGFENVSKEQILMVGDTLQTDILGANRAGIKSCLVVEGGVTEYTILQQGKDVNDKTVMSLIETQQIYPDFVCPKVTEGKLF